jgi:hypothetical protein
MTMPTDEFLNSRLGDPATLAAVAAQEYGRARWVSRHPLVAFGLLPLPAALLLIVATTLLLGLAVSGIGWAVAGDVEKLPRPALVALAYTAAWSVRLVPFTVLAVLFTRLYLRCQVSRWWFAAAAAQVLVVAGSIISLIQYSDEPGRSAWLIGLAWAPFPVDGRWGLPFLHLVGWMQLVQVIVPVAVGALVFRAARLRRLTLADDNCIRVREARPATRRDEL